MGRNTPFMEGNILGWVLLALLATTSLALEVPLEHRLMRNYSRNLELFPMSRHALHYDLLLSQNRDRSLYMMKLLFTGEKFPLKVVADTGSSVLWISGLNCINNVGRQTCGTFVDYFKYGYLDGPIEGDMITTTVYLNEDTASPNTYVLLVRNVTESMDDPLVGLGPKSNPYSTFMEKLLENQVIRENEFTIDLSVPKITFGRVDLPSHLPVVLSITNPLGYYVTLNELTLFGKTLFTTAHDCILDSGNTLIAIPEMFGDGILEAYRANGFRCHSRVESNPAFSNILCDFSAAQRVTGSMAFRFGKHTFQMTADELFVDCAATATGKVCKSAIELHRFGTGVILGQPFFLVYPITFDLGRHELRIWRPTAAATTDAMSI